MKASRIYLLTFLIALVGLSGCNIFEFASSSDNQKSLIEEGRELLRDGDYEGAFNKFTEAIENDPYNSELRYLRAKAAMRRTGTNAITLATEISTLETQSDTPVMLPFLDPDRWHNERADALYQGVMSARGDLRMIMDSSATGMIEPDDILIDFGVVLAVNAILLFRDTNQDQVIDDSDIPLYVFFQNGRLNIQGLYDVVFGYDTLETIDTSPGAEAVNRLIDRLTELLQEGAEAILQFIRDVGEESGISEEILNDVIESIKNGTGKYYVDDDRDNDDDGRVDEEYLNGDDDDLDGWTDEDSNGLRGP